MRQTRCPPERRSGKGAMLAWQLAVAASRHPLDEQPPDWSAVSEASRRASERSAYGARRARKGAPPAWRLLDARNHQAGAPGFLISILPNDEFSGAGFEQAAQRWRSLNQVWQPLSPLGQFEVSAGTAC
jgi:hypothetical protein